MIDKRILYNTKRQNFATIHCLIAFLANCSVSGYIFIVFPIIELNEAAFKHSITEDNIRYAMWHPLHEQLFESYTNKWLIIGYDTAGNLIEIAYNIIDDETVNVFHAMPCRKKFLNQLKFMGGNKKWQG